VNQFAIAIILASTFMHAGWNLQARHIRCEHLFFRRMLIIILLAGLVPSIAAESLLGLLPRKALLCAAGSGIFCGFYFLGLARSFRSTAFTVAYPVARALPVLIVGIVDFFRGRPPTAAGWIGLLLVAIGCLLTPLRSIREINLGRYINRASPWILLTACGTVGYTILDKIASEVVPPGPGAAARYGYLYLAMGALAYIIILRAFGSGGEKPQAFGWKRPAAAGLLNFGAYWLVLWAYQMTERAGYVVAFRQFSIVIGVVIAAALFREGGAPVRITAACIICTGLIFLGLWG